MQWFLEREAVGKSWKIETQVSWLQVQQSMNGDPFEDCKVVLVATNIFWKNYIEYKKV